MNIAAVVTQNNTLYLGLWIKDVLTIYAHKILIFRLHMKKNISRYML